MSVSLEIVIVAHAREVIMKGKSEIGCKYNHTQQNAKHVHISWDVVHLYLYIYIFNSLKPSGAYMRRQSSHHWFK